MRLLLDTHIVLWMAIDRSLLTAGERAAIIDPANDLLVSAISIMELRLKWNSMSSGGERKGPINPRHLLNVLEALGQAVEPMLAAHVAAPLSAPIAHKDPFDELLLTVAQETNCKLLTRDAELRGHPLAFHAD